MAEFKLGRIRFVWKDAWQASTIYYQDDVVSFGGKTYICTIGHTSQTDFFGDLDIVPPKWNLVANGQNWKGAWTTDTDYVYDDIVSYGARLYIANTVHTSASSAIDASDGLELDQLKWDIFAEGLDWKGNWTTSTRYKVNDLVKYGGTTYVCNTLHVSAASEADGLEVDQSNWDYFNQGFEYKSTWVASTRYKINDIVRYGAGAWIAIADHTSSAAFATDVNNWEKFVEGFQYENDWSPFALYQPGDIVRYGGNQYLARNTSTANIPTTDTDSWELFTEGFRFIGDWNEDSSNTSYKVGEVVRLGGFTYVCTADHETAQQPPNEDYWKRVNEGFRWRGEWLDDQEYFEGDVVRYSTTSYICTKYHISEGDDYSTETLLGEGGGAEGSRPDLADSGQYWSAIAVGTEESVLTTTGDLVYYSGNAPTRLPIGKEGQVLRVDGDLLPSWEFLQSLEDVYYVAEHGEDRPFPESGSNIDRPFKTIRYACEQIEKGPKFPNAQYMIELNRSFIQREVTAYIRDQVEQFTTITPTPSSIWYQFDYDTLRCERDVGFILDRIRWDMGHGGNLKVRAAAQTFLNVLSDGPFSTEEENNGTGPYGDLASESEQSVAAYNYMLTLVENILNSEAPDTIYQNVTDDSTAVITQYTNELLEIEPTALSRVTELANVVITVLTTKDTADIPDRVVNQTLVRVSAGKHSEVLPIRVPAYCAILGDELRSTEIIAASGTVPKDDNLYTIETYSRISDIVGDIVVGTSVTPTSGNNEVQFTSWPHAITDQATTVSKLVDTMQYQVDYKLNTMHLGRLTDPTGYSTSLEAARENIKLNIDFLLAEVIAYLEDETDGYPNLKYGKTDTKRDARYVLDAVLYDLTYGGNAQAVSTGLAYYGGEGDDENQLPASIKQATIDSLTYLKTTAQSVAANTLITDPYQTAVTQFITGNVGSTPEIANSIEDIVEIIDTGPTAVGTTVTLVDPTPADGVNTTTALINANNALVAATSTIQSDTINWINTNYPSLVYDNVKCSRDIGIILKAVGYDFMFNSNWQTLKAAHSYLRGSATEVYTLNQKEVTRLAIEYALKTEAIANVNSDATAISRVNASADIIDTVIYGGSNEGSVCQTNDNNVYYAMLQLEQNRDFIKSEVSAWISSQYTDTVTAVTAATELFTVSDTSWMRRNTPIRFSGTVFGGVTEDTTYYVQQVISSTTFTIATTLNAEDPLDITVDATGSMTVDYYYNSVLCLRDVDTYIDAIKMDLMYPGNYSSRFVARYYANAVNGSVEEDMFYLRDATGVRNCSLKGLNGQLTPENQYGTSRCTAGAYCSLDPGFGPDDFKTWIITRSPYVQGVTTFGNAATGQRIDGALHNGGNDSMVSNDFTQVISDGIGAHILNNGRAELVSVFTYYSHIGYLAESGGRVRATNGNNSYGDFGSVAEGVDADETPITAIVDNSTQYKATVSNTLTDNSQLLQVEYTHAGNDYTEVEFNIFGAGSNAELVADEFRDNALNYVLIDQNADPDLQIGGSGYVVASNVAQAGTTNTILLAATDGALSSAYVGMKVYIIGGSGIGQYGIITTYNAGSKEADVIRESDGQPGWDHVIPGTAIVAPNASSTYQVEPRVEFTAPPQSNSAITLSATDTWANVEYFETTAEYIGTAVTGGTGSAATFDVTRNGEKYYLAINAAGTGYTRLDEITIVGTDVGGATTLNDITITVTSVNSVTGAIVDFDFVGLGQKGLFLAIGSGTTGSVSVDGSSWSAEPLPALGAGNWASIATGLLDDGSSTFKPSRIVLVADGSASVAYSTNADTWSSTTLPGAFNSSGENSIAFGQIDLITSRFVAISDADTDIAYSDDGGATWTLQAAALPATGYGELAFGAGRFVAINSGTTSAVYSNNGIVWTGVTAPASFGAVTDIVYGDGKFVALGGTNGTMYSFDGTEWFDGTLALPLTATERKITYGQGVFVITSDDTDQVQWSEDGIYWQAYTVGQVITGGYNAIAFGNPGRTGKFVALPNASGNGGSLVQIGARAKGRASIANEALFEVRITEPGSGYATAPTATVTDPNNIEDVDLVPQLGNGVIGQPTFINRGSGYLTSSVEVDANNSNGNATFPQSGSFIAVRRLTERPVSGSNVEFTSLSGQFFKLVNTISFVGANDGSYTAFLQISPDIPVEDIPPEADPVELRIRFSQVRLTGHDFLDIGTGSFTETNYPGTPTQVPDQAKETTDSDGGRVFYTSTDQDGNFRVGDLFTIEQSTGVATLNAEAFNIAGLQELQLGEVTLGGNSASVNEFSTDPFFTANSDNIVPTQRAIKAYIEAQIGGGGATLNVNSVTAGEIFIGTDTITTVSANPINIKANVLFTGTVLGLPLAYNYFLR